MDCNAQVNAARVYRRRRTDADDDLSSITCYALLPLWLGRYDEDRSVRYAIVPDEVLVWLAFRRSCDV